MLNSSDLWVAGNVPNTQDTGKSASVEYAIGAVQGANLLAFSVDDESLPNLSLLCAGPIKSATLEFDGYTVDGQAFSELSSYFRPWTRSLNREQNSLRSGRQLSLSWPRSDWPRTQQWIHRA